MSDDKTINYYNQNANQYFHSTVSVDMSEMCDRFLGYVKPKGRIIDIGTGSGRDMKYFKDRGFDVCGIQTGEDSEGRYFTNITEDWITDAIAENKALSLMEIWETGDKLNRSGIRWMNVILKVDIRI